MKKFRRKFPFVVVARKDRVGDQIQLKSAFFQFTHLLRLEQFHSLALDFPEVLCDFFHLQKCLL